MKVRSKIKLPYSADRSGVKREIIEIDLKVDKKDDVNKKYFLIASDYIIPENKEDFNLFERVLINQKIYEKTYAEYDSEKDYMLTLKTYSETGSELDDKLLQDALLYSLSIDPIYESKGDDWEAYEDPIPDVEAVVENNINFTPPPFGFTESNI